MMAGAPLRYLVADIWENRKITRDRVALLRFPPGVTLKDAGVDHYIGSGLTPHLGLAFGRLSGLGVEVAATGGWDEMYRVLKRAAATASSVGAFAEDYLDANARLGGERFVTVEEYAMDTELSDGQRLHDALGHLLFEKGGVRAYGRGRGAWAFRDGELPGVLSLPVARLAISEMYRFAPASMPCLLHGGGCRRYGVACVGETISGCVDRRCLYDVRVAVPRRLLDDLRGGDDRQAARAALGVAGLVFDALPGLAWHCDTGRLSRALASLVAMTVAETCEEHAMLAEALQECRSLREMERRARDASWVVSRTLENLRDGW